MSRSHKSNRYGTLAERQAIEQYPDLELDRSSWNDARRDDGSPVEIKAAMMEHRDGQPGTFKLYERYHRRLRAAGGFYLFVVYRPQGRGIEIKRMALSHSSQVPRLSWHGGGDHRSTRQAKVQIGEIFG